MNTAELTAGVANGDRKSLARAISLVENDVEGAWEILENLRPLDIPTVGVTGPPGAGKSTLINALVTQWVGMGKKIGVLCVDPSSPFNFGSLLADRLRMGEHYNTESVFIRSVATRGSLGGLSAKAVEITDVMKSAGFDLIIVETVGVGQSEVEIAGLADTTVLVLVPEAGDDIQMIKSGIMEIGDVLVVNKSDREGADRLVRNLEASLRQRPDDGWKPDVLKTVATSGQGIAEVVNAIEAHYQNTTNDKKAFLLAEKAFHVIRRHRMAGIDRRRLQTDILAEMQKPDFNFYRFLNSRMER